MSTDPELADAPDTPQDIAWEARHCADRLESLSELVWELVPVGLRLSMQRKLSDAASDARVAANLIERGHR